MKEIENMKSVQQCLIEFQKYIKQVPIFFIEKPVELGGLNIKTVQSYIKIDIDDRIYRIKIRYIDKFDYVDVFEIGLNLSNS